MQSFPPPLKAVFRNMDVILLLRVNLPEVFIQEKWHFNRETAISTRSVQVHRIWYSKDCEWNHAVLHYGSPFVPNLDDALGSLEAIDMFGFGVILTRELWESNLTSSCRSEENDMRYFLVNLEAIAMVTQMTEHREQRLFSYEREGFLQVSKR